MDTKVPKVNLNHKSIAHRLRPFLNQNCIDEHFPYADLQSKINELTDKLRLLKSKLSKVIAFHHLGFRGPKEADAWVQEHCPTGRFGLVVEFHTMMEHILQKIKGIDALTDWKRCIKYRSVLTPKLLR